jgi:hypothetical protein
VNGIVFMISLSAVRHWYKRKATHFCMLILYPTTLPKALITSKSFLVESLGSFKYRIISSINRNNVTASFPIYFPFISIFCLIVLAKNSRTVSNKNGEEWTA